jgi:hypothetical protein
MAQILKGTTYTTGDSVTAANINAHVDAAILLPGAIGDQVASGALVGADTILVNKSGGLVKATVSQVADAVEAENLYIKRDGSLAMTADLPLVSSLPAGNLSAASKGYVNAQDAIRDSAIAGKVAKSGDTMTGALTLPGNPVNALHAVPKQYVEQYVASSALSGSIVKSSKYVEFNYASTTSIIPVDDTIPQSTEGLPIISAFITPSLSSNLIRVRASLYCSSPSGSVTGVFAVFRGVNANAIFATSEYFGSALETKQIQFEFFDSPATTSPTQYLIRFGVDAASNTISINGTNSRKFGGVAQCTLVLEEIKT